MKLIVEFLGLSRRLAQTRERTIHVADRATYRDALTTLATELPALVGPIIVAATHDLVSSQLLMVDGRSAVTDLDSPAHDGQTLILMFAEAGG